MTTVCGEGGGGERRGEERRGEERRRSALVSSAS